MTTHRKTILTIIMLILPILAIVASEITFSGGYTKIDMQQGNRRVILSGGAHVSTGTVDLVSDSIELYGDNYRFVTCTGNVSATETERGISFTTPALVYDRTDGTVRSDGWIEIQDTQHEVALSGAWFEYDMNSRFMKLQMMAKILKVTDEGLMVCRADSIEYDGEANTVALKGNATVSWNNDTYKAAMIIVDLNTNGISLYGTISGEFNG